MSILSIYLDINKMADKKLSLPEVLLLLALKSNTNIDRMLEKLEEENLITIDPIELTPQGKEAIEDMLGNSIKWSDSNLTSLAEKLKAIYPKGRKPGTNYYWADGASLIVKRLRIFFKKYGEQYSEQQILDATKRYVEAYQNDMQYMQLLKYFIFKEKINVNHELESQSDLLNYIENASEIDDDSDWQSELI